MLRRPQVARWSIVGLLALTALLVPATGFAKTTISCPRTLDDGVAGTPVHPAITLAPDARSAQRIMNFDASRATKFVHHVTFTADKPLPPSVTTQQLSFDAFLSRAGDTLESTDFPDPAFSQPRISPDRQSITFNICLKPGSIPPGKYVGTVTLSGPPGLSPASLSLTINAKTDTLFYLGSLISLLIAAVLVLLKDAAAYKQTDAKITWPQAFSHPAHDPLWLATTIAALAAAFGTLYAVYAANPAWGSGGFSDIASLIAAGFAAVGGATILSTLTPS